MVHNDVRKRWLEGDEFIKSSMVEVGNLAIEGRAALSEKNYIKFAELMNRNFDSRKQMFGDDSLGLMNIDMVKEARKLGAASKFTGSGGAVIVYCPEGPSQVKCLEDACQETGFIVRPVEVVSSFLK